MKTVKVQDKGADENSIPCIPKGEGRNPPITNRGYKGGKSDIDAISWRKIGKK